jgi:hypothetical protein
MRTRPNASELTSVGSTSFTLAALKVPPVFAKPRISGRRNPRTADLP